MAPLIPRMHLFEIADTSWCPDFLRSYVQAALTAAWTTHVPFLQASSPAQLVARLLATHLGPGVRDYVFIDFCAGGGGPTPSIERHLSSQIASASAAAATTDSSSSSSPSESHPNPNHDEQQQQQQPPQQQQQKGAAATIRFVLTDLHPHTDLWARAAARSPNVSYVPYPVDAARAPRDLVARHKRGGGGGDAEGSNTTTTKKEEEQKKKKVFRLFNLAFHHFDDGLARRILRDTVEGSGGAEGKGEASDGFGIFELQDRSLAGFLACCLFGIGVLILAPYYALLWGEPLALLFTYIVPVLPIVLVVDGWVSCLRTRTADEVEALLRTCGAEGGDDEIAKWEVKSGSETFMWPVGRLNWIICVKR